MVKLLRISLIKALCFIWIHLILLNTVVGDGIVYVRFIRYVNQDGAGSNGQCCDGKWGMCKGQCDHQFTVCLDGENGGSSVDSCKYGRIETKKIKDQNVNVFGSKFINHPNPVEFKIRGSINIMAKLKIRVMDVDSGAFNSDDHVDDLTADIYIHKGPFADITMPLTLHSRTRMETQIIIKCDTNWFTEDCSVYCNEDKDANYYCDGWTGDKICHPGWQGENCDIKDSNFG